MQTSFESVFYDARNSYKKKEQKMGKEGKEKKKKCSEKKYNFKSSEVYARPVDGYKTIQFYSRSKSADAKYLSTMQPCELYIGGKTYMSMEHYFQAQKYPADKRYLFEKNGKYKTAKEAKSAGSKTGMKKNGEVLNLKKWNGLCSEYTNEFFRVRVMKKAIWARFKQDKRFRDIICTPKTFFIHYEKKRGKFNPKKIPAWGSYKSKEGGWCGLNILGLLYLEIARFHDIPDWLEKDGKLNWRREVWVEGNAPFKPWRKGHPLIPHRAIVPRREWKYGGFVYVEEYKVCVDSSIILHC